MKLMSASTVGAQAHIAVFGMGYVGCFTAACLASIGHRVVGVDTDQHTVGAIKQGQALYYEPGLEEVIRAAVASARLTATVDVSAALRDADVALLCVGTPSERNGNLSLDQLRKAAYRYWISW